MSEFIQQRDKIKKFLSERRLLVELSKRAKVNRRTVDNAFMAETQDAMSNRQIIVWNEALNMIYEINMLVDRIKVCADSIQ